GIGHRQGAGAERRGPGDRGRPADTRQRRPAAVAGGDLSGDDAVHRDDHQQCRRRLDVFDRLEDVARPQRQPVAVRDGGDDRGVGQFFDPVRLPNQFDGLWFGGLPNDRLPAVRLADEPARVPHRDADHPASLAILISSLEECDKCSKFGFLESSGRLPRIDYTPSCSALVLFTVYASHYLRSLCHTTTVPPLLPRRCGRIAKPRSDVSSPRCCTIVSRWKLTKSSVPW